VQTLTINVDPAYPKALPIPGSFVSNVAGLDPPGLPPHLSRFVPGGATEPKHSVVWNYDTVSGLLNPGSHSDILFFASPYGPHMVLSSIGGGLSSGDSQALPSPVPEPTTVVLSVIAAACLLTGAQLRRRHRRTS